MASIFSKIVKGEIPSYKVMVKVPAGEMEFEIMDISL